MIGQPDGRDGAERSIPKLGANPQNRCADSRGEIGHDRRHLHRELLQRLAHRAIRHHVAGSKLQTDFGIGAGADRGHVEIDQQLGLQVAFPEQRDQIGHAFQLHVRARRAIGRANQYRFALQLLPRSLQSIQQSHAHVALQCCPSLARCSGLEIVQAFRGALPVIKLAQHLKPKTRADPFHSRHCLSGHLFNLAAG